MVVVHNLNERLDLRAPADLLLRHSVSHLEGGAIDARHKSVTIMTLLGTIVKILDDNSLLAGVAAVEDDNDLTLLQTENGKSEFST